MTESILPRRFGRYMLFDRIGEGGMAEIFLARASTELGGSKLVVVKQILPHLAENAQFAEMLTSEAKLASRLTHSNVVQVTDLGRHAGRLFIAMEYVEGMDLNALLKGCSQAKVPLPIEFALFIVMESLKGLDYAHRRRDDEGKKLGLVHRDVSPSNLLISFEGEVKVCDFGIAHANHFGVSSDDENIQGKAGYMSPEHARGDALDKRADVFAIGTVLWELLAGRRRYKKREGMSLLEVAKAAEYEPPRSRGLPAEEDIFQIVGKALSPDISKRYKSAQAMLRDLEDYVAKAHLMASPLRLGDWLRETFGTGIIEERQTRERALRALEKGPAVVLEPIGSVNEAPPSTIRGSSIPSTQKPDEGGFPWAWVAIAAVVVLGLGFYFARLR